MTAENTLHAEPSVSYHVNKQTSSTQLDRLTKEPGALTRPPSGRGGGGGDNYFRKLVFSPDGLVLPKIIGLCASLGSEIVDLSVPFNQGRRRTLGTS